MYDIFDHDLGSELCKAYFPNLEVKVDLIDNMFVAAFRAFISYRKLYEIKFQIVDKLPEELEQDVRYVIVSSSTDNIPQEVKFKPWENIHQFCRERGIYNQIGTSEENEPKISYLIYDGTYLSLHMGSAWIKYLSMEDYTDTSLNTEADKTLSKAIADKDRDKVVNEFDKITSSLSGFLQHKREIMLREFSNNLFKQSKDSCMRSIARVKRDIKDYEVSIAEKISTLRELERKMFSYDGQDISDFISYLTTASNIEITSARDDTLKFLIKGNVDNFDEEYYKIIRENKDSYLYDVTNISYMISLFDAIFLDRRFEIRQQSEYMLNIANSRCHAIQESHKSLDCNMFNVHANDYDCFGDYSPMMSRALLNMDYIGAVQICSNLNSSLNLADSTVAKKTLEYLANHCSDYLLEDMETGEILSPAMAIEILKKEGVINGESD